MRRLASASKLLEQIVDAKLLAKSPNRRVIRRRIAKRQANKGHETQTIGQRRLHLGIGQAMPALQEQRLEHDECRIGRLTSCATGRALKSVSNGAQATSLAISIRA
jgi:hypothetical protein